MFRSRSITFVAGAAAVPLIALVAAGCGGSSNSSSSSAAATTQPKTSSGQAATVGTASVGNLGTVLVDAQGRTLYLFQKDSGGQSSCFGACASAWPPLRANGKPTAGTGLNSSQLATVNRSDGKPQVTYNGHPLYLFSGDQNAGDANGEGSTAFGGSWFALDAAGNQVSGQASSSTTTSGGGGGYGY